MVDIQIVKSLDPKADQAVLNAFRELNYPFEPGTQRGIKVKTKMVIPITFNPVP